MKRPLRAMGLVGLTASVLGGGCSLFTKAPQSAVLLYNPHAAEETLTRSGSEHYQEISRIMAHDGKALAEDLDMFFQTDRPTRLTRWHD